MPQRNEELDAWIDVSLVPGLGPVHFRTLLSEFGLPRNILDAGVAALARVVPKGICPGHSDTRSRTKCDPRS